MKLHSVHAILDLCTEMFIHIDKTQYHKKSLTTNIGKIIELNVYRFKMTLKNMHAV